MDNFDPNAAGTGEGIFGLPFSADEAQLIILTCPFEATTSYLGGTSKAPERVYEASQQVDLYHPNFGNAWQKGIHFLHGKTAKKIRSLNTLAQRSAKASRRSKGKTQQRLVKEVNQLSNQALELLRKEVEMWLAKGKKVALLGGDHSTPLPVIAETVKRYPEMGVLHLDAHFDLRQAYEGFENSHASIFYNVMTKTPLKKLVQIGLRDYSEPEIEMARTRSEIEFFTDADLFSRKAKGESWHAITQNILSALPQQVYLSFDIDGLDPSFCPATGTPVPGGLSYQEISYLLQEIVRSGREIVGFDLVEVGPQEWDANVGARMLYQMSLAALSS